MKHLLSFLLAAVSCEAKSIVTDDLVHKVGIIESNLNEDAIGDGGKSRGAFQIGQRAWADAVAYSICHGGPHDPGLPVDWKEYSMNYDIAHHAAELILRMHEDRMIRNKIKPTPIKLYMAYNMGYHMASSFGFNMNVTSGKRRAILLRAYNILSK
jgi:hypothetical protein